jgi:hypothetical protein
VQTKEVVIVLCEFVKKLESFLKNGDYLKSIAMMRSWLAAAEPGDPVKLLDSCSSVIRPNVTLLLRDVMSRYPSTLLGCPLLLYAVPEGEIDSPVPSVLELPVPRPEAAKPCPELHFIGWLSADTQLPIKLPYRPADHRRTIPWHTPTSVVALFRSHPGVVDLEKLDLPYTWWGEMFLSIQGNVRLEGSLLLSYPDSLDIAVAQQAGSRGEPLPTGHFTRDIGWAYETGIVFEETARSQFSN